MMEEWYQKVRKDMCEDDLSTKIGGYVQVIETALKYKESQGLERAISRQPWRKRIIKCQSKSRLR